MYKVIKDFKGSPDGYTVIQYLEGQEVELSLALADVALKEKWAKKLPIKAREDAEAQAKAEAQAQAKADAIAALQGDIAATEALLATAVEADQPALEAVWLDLQAKLAELQK